MDTKDNFLNIAPEVTNQERDCILVLRGMKACIAKITVHDSKPVTLSIRYPDFIDRQELYAGPLGTEEQQILTLVKFLQFGEIYVQKNEQGKMQILGDSEQRFRLGEIDWLRFQKT